MKYQIIVNDAVVAEIEETMYQRARSAARKMGYGLCCEIREVRDLLPGEKEYNDFHAWEMREHNTTKQNIEIPWYEKLRGDVRDIEECPLTSSQLDEAEKYARFLGGAVYENFRNIRISLGK